MSLEASSVVHASRHYEKAGLRSQAFRTSLTAAGEASRISARQEAYELYQRAIANMPEDLPVLEQAELSSLAAAAGAIEQNEDMEIAAIRARELYLEAGRPIDAAGQALTMFSSPPSRRADREPGAPSWTRPCRVADLPATPEREALRAWLIIYDAERRFLALDLERPRTLALQAVSSPTRWGTGRPSSMPRSCWVRSTSSTGSTRAACATGCVPPARPAMRATNRRRHRVSEPRDPGRPDHGSAGRRRRHGRGPAVRRRHRAIALPADDRRGPPASSSGAAGTGTRPTSARGRTSATAAAGAE